MNYTIACICSNRGSLSGYESFIAIKKIHPHGAFFFFVSAAFKPYYLGQIAEPPLQEGIECHFSYSKSAPPDLVSPLFGIIIPLLMIVFHKIKPKPEPEPETPCPRYLDLKVCILKSKDILSQIQPLIDELTQLEGKKSQSWNLAVYEDYISDLNEHLKIVQPNRSDDKAFHALEEDVQYFVKEIKEEHRFKFLGKEELLNHYRLRLFHPKNSTGKVDQNRSLLRAAAPRF